MSQDYKQEHTIVANASYRVKECSQRLVTGTPKKGTGHEVHMIYFMSKLQEKNSERLIQEHHFAPSSLILP